MTPLWLAALVSCWIALTALLLGGAVVRFLGSATWGPGRRLVLAAAVGLAGLAYATLALGLAHLYLRTALLALLLAGDLLGLIWGWRILADLRALAARGVAALRHSPQRALYWILLLWALTVLLPALLPPGGTDWDGLAEHLAMAKVWLQQGALVPLWYDHHSQFPATVQMLYVLGLDFGGPVAAKLLNTFLGLLALATVGLLARAHYSRASAPLAMLVLATTPLVGWLSAVAYVDLGAVLYLTLGLLLLLDYLRAPRRGVALWSGVCLGLGMAVKLQGLLYCGALALAVAVVAYRRTRSVPRPQARHLLALAGVALAVASPWYVKSWILTGNPVYPFAYGIFGGRQWSAEQARTYTYEQKAWGWGGLPAEEEFWRLSPWQRAFAGPRRPDHLLLAPLGLTFLPWEYADKGLGDFAALMLTAVGPLYLAFLPLLLLGPRPRAWALTAWAWVPLWLWWLATSQYSRYLLPGLAWLAPAAGYAAAQALARGGWLRHAARSVLGLSTVLALSFNLLHALPGLPLLLGQQTQAQYLAASLGPLSSVLSALDQQMGSSDVLISYGEPRLFYLNHAYLWGDPNYHRLLDYATMRSGDDLVAAYARQGISYLLVNKQFFPAERPRNLLIARLLKEGVARGRLRLVLAATREQPYEVLRVAAPPLGGPAYTPAAPAETP